jgi:hypothetical protein
VKRFQIQKWHIDQISRSHQSTVKQL